MSWSLSYFSSREVTADAMWPTKPKMFTLWSFTEKVCQPHFKRIIFFLDYPLCWAQDSPSGTLEMPPRQVHTHFFGPLVRATPVPWCRGCLNPFRPVRHEELFPSGFCLFVRSKSKSKCMTQSGISRTCYHGPGVQLVLGEEASRS